MHSTETLLEMQCECGRQKKPMECLYRLLRYPDLLLTAYGITAVNQGSMTLYPMANDTANRMNREEIIQLITTVEQDNYRWKPVA